MERYRRKGASMRAMRLARRAVNDAGRVLEIIDACQVLRIGAVDDEGMFIVPVNFGYVWDEDASLPHFYVHSAREGRKADAFRPGAPVAVELDWDRGNIEGDYSCAYSRSYASIMGSGYVCEVTDEKERLRALELIMAHAAPGASTAFTAEGIGRVAIFRIDVTQLTAKERLPK